MFSFGGFGAFIVVFQATKHELTIIVKIIIAPISLVLFALGLSTELFVVCLDPIFLAANEITNVITIAEIIT
jgi:hypothetical protein